MSDLSRGTYADTPPPPKPPDTTPNGREIGYQRFTINAKCLGHGEPLRVKEGRRHGAKPDETIQLSLGKINGGTRRWNRWPSTASAMTRMMRRIRCKSPSGAPAPQQLRTLPAGPAASHGLRFQAALKVTRNRSPDGRGSVGPELLSRDRKGAVCKGLTPFHQAPPEAQLSRDRERERFAKVSLSRDRKGAVCKDLTEPRP